IKPDLVAPGEDIYAATESTVPSGQMYNPDGFASDSGTSFSAPHVTGAIALLFQKYPKLSPSQVRAILMDTADPQVSADATTSAIPSVMEIGSGLLNAGAALSATAYVSPPSHSFGEINEATGPTTRTVTLTVTDLAGKGGQWQVGVQRLHGAAGLTIATPPAVALPAGGRVRVPIKVSATSTTPSGDYDGFITLSSGAQTLHAPFFVHVIAQKVLPGSVLLVDDSTNRLLVGAGQAPIPHLNVRRYYEQALADIGKSYTLWDESALGPPTLQDMKAASAVIYFTGDNLGGYTPQNTNYEALQGPLGAADVSALHAYLDAGGRLFVSGRAAALSDPNWSAIVMGGMPSADAVDGAANDLSIYDNERNDRSHAGRVSPPQPSAVADSGAHANRWIFGDLKPIDLSSRGDGANDNLATYSPAVQSVIGDGFVGVPGLIPVYGRSQYGFQGMAYGQGALRTTNRSLAQAGFDIAVVSSDEPSFAHRPAYYPGRAVLFSFDFEGIDDNTGYATRDQVLRRIFQWFGDRPTASVSGRVYAAGQPVRLKATLRGNAAPVRYQWQVGNSTLPPSSAPTSYRFARPGRYNIRVQVRDALGHQALSPWTAVTVR
ncbi:MAG: S8 family serine peptidase, partial [Chloroflexi bacterium]|nr:S8 family serine peptidase [Chloroflexota bacterium]